MQTWSIKLNYSSNEARAFLYKSSSCAKHKWHCIINFLINAALLNVYLILHYHLFFWKEIYFFECLYFTEFQIRVPLYVFCLRKELSIKHIRNSWGNAGLIQNAYNCLPGRRCHSSCVRTHLHYLFSWFW